MKIDLSKLAEGLEESIRVSLEAQGHIARFEKIGRELSGYPLSVQCHC